MKNKYLTCTYNANRKCSTIAEPFCTYTKNIQNIKFPPNIYWCKYKLTEYDCNMCECYEKALDVENVEKYKL